MTPKQTLLESEPASIAAEPRDYTILHEHRRTDGSFKSLEELEIEYIELTDSLIFKMTHGEKVTSGGERERVIPTKVIFLDKSARPLAWLVRDLWDTLAPDPGSDVIPKQPDFKFLNIDRKQWRGQLDPNKTLGFDAGLLTTEQVEGLRSIFNLRHDGSFEAENELDDEVIMVIDEVKSTGDTLTIAQAMLQRAFPTSKVFGAYWMEGIVQKANGANGNADLPVWYRDDSTNAKFTVGRGIGNRRDPARITDPSQYFLSTRLPEVDQRALRLRDDFKMLRDALKKKDVIYVPDRDREDTDERSEKINGRPLTEVYMARRAIQQADKTR